MAKFSYKAKDKKGSPVDGTLDADSRGAVTSKLRQMGYFPISIQEVGGSKSPSPRRAVGSLGGKKAAVGAAKKDNRGGSVTKILPKLGSKKNDDDSPVRTTNGGVATASMSKVNVSKVNLSKLQNQKLNSQKQAAKPKPKAKPKASPATQEQSFVSFGKNRIKASDLASFNRQLADLLGAGVPLVKSLSILQKQTANNKLAEIIAEINTDVSGGDTFADALGKHPKEFSKLYTAMVRSGEAGGMLDDVLNRLADFSEAEEQLKSKIKSALAYPVVMIIAGAFAVGVMFVYIIPKITGVFKELNQTLPALTQTLITTSEFTQQYWYVVVGVIAGLVIALNQLVKTEEGKLFWHRTQLRIPILGDVVRKREVARFSRTLGSLLKNGVSILAALKITRDVLNNEIVKGELDEVIDGITQGTGIAEPLKHSVFFPPVTINMMTVGEETGQLETVLLRISDSFETEVDRKVRTLTSLIEPLIIVVMGFVVGFIVIAMLLPIFNLNPGGG